MRYVDINEAQAGMVIAFDIFDSFGNILLSKSTSLNDSSIEKLHNLGLDGIYISDEISRDINIKPVISPELRAKGMESVRECNVEKCKDVASQIVEEIIDSGAIYLDMADIRTHDDVTFAHSVNVSVISCGIGFGLKMSSEDLVELVLAGLLHDFGKTSIPIEILNKPGRLSQEEYLIMKSHAQQSYDLIKNREDLSDEIKSAVLHHHENVDGTGYPDGIDGKQQSLFTRILHVADVYDALVSNRPYKLPYSPNEAIEYLMGGSGIMFDRLVVATLINYVPIYPKGRQVVLSNGSTGIVMENGGEHNLRPIVRLMDGTVIDLLKPVNLITTIKNFNDCNSLVVVESEAQREKMVDNPNKYKIIAADEEMENLQHLEKILGYMAEIIPFQRGEDVLLYLQNNPKPDMIIMDVELKSIGGIETAKKINELTDGNLPIVFVTVHSDKNTVLACRTVNAAGYVIKPYTPTFIRTEVKRILTGRNITD